MRAIDADRLQKRFDEKSTNPNYRVNMHNIKSIISNAPTVEAIPKADYEARLKADLKAILVELQLEIKELWDNRHDVWLDNQYYIGKSDTLGEVDEIIQEKIDKLKEG